MTSPSARQRRVERVFEELVEAGGSVTVTQIAARLAVSPRSVHRDLAELRSLGVPIVGTIGVGIELDLEAALRLRVSAAEALAVLEPSRLLAWLRATLDA